MCAPALFPLSDQLTPSRSLHNRSQDPLLLLNSDMFPSTSPASFMYDKMSLLASHNGRYHQPVLLMFSVSNKTCEPIGQSGSSQLHDDRRSVSSINLSSIFCDPEISMLFLHAKVQFLSYIQPISTIYKVE